MRCALQRVRAVEFVALQSSKGRRRWEAGKTASGATSGCRGWPAGQREEEDGLRRGGASWRAA